MLDKSIKMAHNGAREVKEMYRIFIVEDDDGIARGVAKQVRAWGMEAVTATDFQNVTGQFAACQPHLVLMDIGLPFMNGYHWCS